MTYYDFYDKFRSNSILKETDMAFKEYDRKPSFLDMELQRAFGQGQSRTQQSLTEIDKIINWRSIEKIVTENYPVGQSEYGNKAYPPLLLLKASLIQKWFGIHSDPELEIQINDRLSFKAFIGLPFREPSPDHSIICRFRERIGKDTLERIHHELLEQFSALGFSLESGMAVDARVIRSASRPVSTNNLDALREKKDRTKMRKKTQRAMRFQRDCDSTWTVKNKQPVFGMKEHACVDVESGLVLSTCVSRASEHDTTYFSYVVTKGIHGKGLPETVYADKGYCGKANREFLSMNGIGDGIMRKNQINASLTETEIHRNKTIAKVRYKIEQYFGLTHKYRNLCTTLFENIMIFHTIKFFIYMILLDNILFLC